MIFNNKQKKTTEKTTKPPRKETKPTGKIKIEGKR